MSRIRGKNTKPEMIVRRWLWDHGFRYRLHVKRLPGSPDIVIRKHKTVIFINGCFWHGHNTTPQTGGELADSDCCRIPHTNRQFWLDKINRNIARDMANIAKYRRKGWRVLTVWECDLKGARRQATLDALLVHLTHICYPTTYTDTPEISIAAEQEYVYGQQDTSPHPSGAETTNPTSRYTTYDPSTEH